MAARSARESAVMPIRLLMGKLGLDGHDRGVKVVCRALRDAGFEVVYTGLQQTPEEVVATAVQEDVAGVGISILSGAHLTLMPELVDHLRRVGAEEMSVFCGGIIPDRDIQQLYLNGVEAVFTPGVSLELITSWARQRFMAANE